METVLKRHTGVALIAVLFAAAFSVALYATEPPPLPTPLPPQIQLPPPPTLSSPPSDPAAPPLTAEQVRRLPLSPLVKQWWLSTIENPPSVVREAAAARPNGAAERDEAGPALRHRAEATQPNRSFFPIAPLTSAYAPTRQSADTRYEQETTIAANSCLDTCSPMRISGYIKFNADYALNNVRASLWVTDEYANNYQLPLPAERTLAADPIIAVNPYSGGAGWSAYRTYIVGTNYGPPSFSSDIDVWYQSSLSGWAGPISVAHEPNQNSFFLDKPSIAVSWFADTLGEVYVAYLRIASNGAEEIHVARSDDGGNTWLQTAVLGGLQRVQSPTVVVSPATGEVYLFWVDYAASQIRARKSDASATAFVTLPSLAAGTFLDENNDRICTASLCIQARSTLMARYNPSSSEIGVVWHVREPGNAARTDVRFAALKWGDTWTPFMTVNEATDSSQWNGALDTNGQGFLITFYDTRNDTTNLHFDIYAEKVTSNATRYDLHDTRVTPVSGVTQQMRPSAANVFTMGEYQDVWLQSGWTASYVHSPNNICDVYWSVIVP